MRRVDLNCDLGEGYNDEAIMPFISSCNIACGGHAGDRDTVAKTINLAIKHKVAIGAHPSYPDKENFGRKTTSLPHDVLLDEVCEQIKLVLSICTQKATPLHHIKPHGAMYNDIAKDEALAMAFIKRMQLEFPSTPIYLLANSSAAKLALDLNIKIYQEVFADRVYKDHNTLQSRSIDGAVLTKSYQVLNQLDNFTEGKVIDINNKDHEISADTICLHSDTANAVNLAQEIYNHLKSKQIAISCHK